MKITFQALSNIPSKSANIVAPRRPPLILLISARHAALLRRHPGHGRLRARLLLALLLEIRRARLPPVHHRVRPAGVRTAQLRELRLSRVGQRAGLDDRRLLRHHDTRRRGVQVPVDAGILS